MVEGHSKCCPPPKPRLQAATMTVTGIKATWMTLKSVAAAASVAKGAEVDGIALHYHLICSVTSTALIQFRSINSRVDGSPLGLEGIVVDAFAFHLVRDEVAARSPSSMGARAVPAMVEVTIL